MRNKYIVWPMGGTVRVALRSVNKYFSGQQQLIQQLKLIAPNSFWKNSKFIKQIIFMCKVGKCVKHSRSESLPLLRHCRDPMESETSPRNVKILKKSETTLLSQLPSYVPGCIHRYAMIEARTARRCETRKITTWSICCITREMLYDVTFYGHFYWCWYFLRNRVRSIEICLIPVLYVGEEKNGHLWTIYSFNWINVRTYLLQLWLRLWPNEAFIQQEKSLFRLYNCISRS